MPRLKDPKIGMFSIILITDFPIFSGNQAFQSTALDDRFSPFSSIIVPAFKIIVRLSFHVCHQNLTAQLLLIQSINLSYDIFPKQTGKDGGLHSKILGELSQVLYR